MFHSWKGGARLCLMLILSSSLLHFTKGTASISHSVWISGNMWLMRKNKDQNQWSFCVTIVGPMGHRE